MKPNKNTLPKVSGLTNPVRLSDRELIESFVDSLPATKPGANNLHLADLLPPCRLLLANYRTFSLSDFATLLRNLDLDNAEIKCFFERFTLFAQSAGRLSSPAIGCYDEALWIVI